MIISRTPLRISFAGGGTDLPAFYRNPRAHGAVVSSAIDWYIYITVNKKFDDLIRVSYSKTELVDHVDDLQHNIIREALKLAGIEKGIDIVCLADIPAGTGLGSSSSLAVGVLNALYAYKGSRVSPERLARDACHIEMEVLGHTIGKQDQYAAAYGGLNFIQFNDDDSVIVDPLICSRKIKKELSSKLILFYTNISRQSTSILEEQSDSVSKNRSSHDDLVKLAYKLRNELESGVISRFGKILDDGWRLKTRLAPEITSPQLDEWYSKAKDAGAAGGKIAGAGGGGFLLLYCDEDKQDDVKIALSDLNHYQVGLEPQGSKIIYFSD